MEEFINKKQKENIVILFFLMFALFVIVTVFYYLLISIWGDSFFQDFEFFKAIVYFELGLITAVFCYKVDSILDSYWNKRIGKEDNGKRGREGEDIVKKELERIFSRGNYKIYKNFKIPGRKFDIDFVVIGPKGVIVIEVKNYSGEMLFYKDHALKRTNGVFGTEEEFRLSGKKDPRSQVVYHSAIFDQYLTDLGFENLQITKVLVFVDNVVKKRFKNPDIEVISGVKNLEKFLVSLKRKRKFTSAFCDEINEAFENAWRG